MFLFTITRYSLFNIHCFQDGNNFYLVFEKLEGGPLLDQLRTRNYFSEYEASLIVKDLAK